MSTHYTAGGMPLVFMQEDFLVKYFYGFYSIFIFYVWPPLTIG